jgi:hypothetical protein
LTEKGHERRPAGIARRHDAEDAGGGRRGCANAAVQVGNATVSHDEHRRREPHVLVDLGDRSDPVNAANGECVTRRRRLP